MKHILVLAILICPYLLVSQNVNVSIDYLVDYLIPNTKTNSTDTISIGYSKDGKYLYTNYKKIGLDIAKKFSKNLDKDSSVSCHLIYGTEEANLIVGMTVEGNFVFMNMNISSLLPESTISADGNSFELILEPTGETITYLNEEARIFNMFTANDPNDILTVVTSQQYKMNNSKIFEKLFELIFQTAEMGAQNAPEMPEGIILKVAEGNNTMLRAIAIKEIDQTIKFNYSFNISE